MVAQMWQLPLACPQFLYQITIKFNIGTGVILSGDYGNTISRVLTGTCCNTWYYNYTHSQVKYLVQCLINKYLLLRHRLLNSSHRGLQI